MGPSALRSQLRTNIPGDTRVSGRFNTDGVNAPSVLEGKRYVVDHTGTGLYRIRFGNSTSELTPVLGLIACFATPVVALPATNPRWIVVQSIVTNADGTIAGVILGALDDAGALADLAANDDICFECIVRDTAVTV